MERCRSLSGVSYLPHEIEPTQFTLYKSRTKATVGIFWNEAAIGHNVLGVFQHECSYEACLSAIILNNEEPDASFKGAHEDQPPPPYAAGHVA